MSQQPFQTLHSFNPFVFVRPTAFPVPQLAFEEIPNRARGHFHRLTGITVTARPRGRDG